MTLQIRDILSSQPTHTGDEAMKLGLYVWYNYVDDFYYYTGALQDHLLVELTEAYWNNYAYVEVLANHMYTPYPIHLLRYDGFKGSLSVPTWVLTYNNGAIGLEQVEGRYIINLWIAKNTVDIFKLPTPEQLHTLTGRTDGPATPLS